MRKKQRITILVALFLVVIVGGGGAIVFRQYSLNQRALENRALGMAAAAAENHRDALHLLGRYLQRFGQEEDAEALYEYARARFNVPLVNNKHVGQSIGLFLQVLAIERNHEGAQQELLQLYAATGYSQETLDLAKKVLDRDADNVDALTAEANALVQLRRFDEALERTTKIAELAPLNIENHLLALAVMMDADASNEKLRAYPDAQKGLVPDSAPYQTITAVAARITGDLDEARSWAEKAAESVDPKSNDVMLVNGLLTTLGLYEESLALLQRTAPDSENQDLLNQYCRRLFETGNTAEVLAQTDVPATEQLNSSLLALRAMAAGREKNTEEVERIVLDLEGRSDDTIADSWTPILRAIWLRTDTPPQEIVQLCTTAIESNQANPFFHYFQGIAYEQMGEKEQAISAWQRTIGMAPTWIDPILRGAELLAGIDRHHEAFGLVQEALRRAPQNVNVAAAAAEIIGANVENLSSNDQTQLLRLCEQVQQARPQDPRVLPLIVELRARTGDKEGATEALRSALEGENTFRESTLLKLANTSDTHGLGLSDSCFELLNQRAEMTPSRALAKAASALQNGDEAAAWQRLSDEAHKAGDTLPWKIAKAQFLDRTNPDEAVKAWTTIAESAQDNAGLLQRILDSNSAWRDSDLIDRVIESLKSTTGESALAWRAARARWLLLTDTSQKSAAEAATLLNDTMRASIPDAGRYLLLATALDRLSNKEGALDALQKAAQIQPDNTRLQFQLAQMLNERGQSEQAMTHLLHVTNNAATSQNDLQQAAALLARQGHVQVAIDALSKRQSEDGHDDTLDLLLAQLHRRAGQMDEAEAICQRLLDKAPDARTIEFTADLLAVQGRVDEAKTVLAQLDSLPTLTPGTKEMILAEFNRVHGASEEAARWYEAAIEADSSRPMVWHKLLAYLSRNGEMKHALERLPQAAEACPTDESLALLNQNHGLIDRLHERTIAIPFILAALETPRNSGAALEVLKTLDETPKDDADQLINAFTRLSGQHPDFLTLKMQLVRLYAALNRHDEAAELASAAMYDFPNEIEPALLAAEALAAKGDWIGALSAGRQWRQRSPSNPDAADLFIATAQIGLDRSSEALETIRPYLADAEQDPTQYSPIVANQARALIKSGQESEAAALLQPRLELAGAWRMLWLQLALLDLPNDTLAVEWLDTVAPHIPTDALDEHLTLANAWFSLAQRTKSPAHQQKAQALIETLAQRPDVDGKTVFALAVSQEVDGNVAAAETNYLRALELDPNLTPAKNNLAMRYVTDHKKLDEALKLAQEIVAAVPSNANYHDTLSQVYEQLGNLDAATKAAQQAAQLQPKNPQWISRVEQLEVAKGQENPDARPLEPSVNLLNPPSNTST